MANTRAGNVVRIDTTADLTDIRSICGIKYIGNTNGTARVEKYVAAGNGNLLWEQDGTSDLFEDVQIRSNVGIRVEITNGAVVYLYLGR